MAMEAKTLRKGRKDESGKTREMSTAEGTYAGGVMDMRISLS